MATLAIVSSIPKRVPRSLDEVMRYQHPVIVQRFQEKLGLKAEDAQQLFSDTLLFLYLSAISTESLAPTESLDAGWHEFLLFTRDYERFCLEHFGFFIHHRPRHPQDPPDKGKMGGRALALAHQFFGDNLSENWRYPLFTGVDSTAPCTNSCGCSPACNDE